MSKQKEILLIYEGNLLGGTAEFRVVKLAAAVIRTQNKPIIMLLRSVL